MKRNKALLSRCKLICTFTEVVCAKLSPDCLQGSGLVSGGWKWDLMLRTDFNLEILNDQVIQSIDVFFPAGSGMFQDGCQDSSGSDGDRQVQGASDSIFFGHQSPDQNPVKNL